MQKGLHTFSKAVSIGILSVILRVHRLGWSFSLCQAFCSNIVFRNDRRLHKYRKSFLLSPLSLAYSDPNDSLTSAKMTSTASIAQTRNDTALMNDTDSKPIKQFFSSPPPSSELSTMMLDVISSSDDVDMMTMLSGQILDDACRILRQFIETPTTNMEFNDISEVDDCFSSSGGINESSGDEGLNDVDDRRTTLSSYASIAAERLCQIAHATDNNKDKASRKNKKRTWEALQNAAGILQTVTSVSTATSIKTATNATTLPLKSNALAVSMVFGALSFLEQQQCQHEAENSRSAKAAASALSSTISRNNLLQQAGRPISSLLLQCYIDHAFRNEKKGFYFDLNILNHFAKSFQLTEGCVEPIVVAAIVRNTVQLIDTSDQREDLLKQSISGAFALACQLRPWSILSPVELIDAATAYDFYHSAEEICRSAHKAAKDAERSLLPNSDENNKYDNKDGSNHRYSASRQEENAMFAVEKLIDTAIESRMYRRADSMATSLYDLGGRSRYVEARYLHACDTIAKVISRRQFPIVDRQIERVDKAIAKVEPCNDEGKKHGDDGVDNRNNDQTIGDGKINGANEKSSPQTSVTSSLLHSPGVEIREYAIQKLEDAGEIVAAQRLASIYNIDYVYDEEAALLAAAMRREKYLQYDDVLPDEVPPLITEPDEIISGFDRLLREEVKNSLSSNRQRENHIGFDAEWDEETQGAALLQLASAETVLLIDILALSSTEEGVNALRQTVGKLLDNPEWTLIGFACRQDLSRLRASPCVQEQHWMSMTNAVVDMQPLIGIAEPSLRTTGLSRACEHFLGKPLDKSEQCSMWSSRPLTDRQRSYASLDAWVCVGVYQKLLRIKNDA
jgi:hypothetical protein